jgi:hypothetical protein
MSERLSEEERAALWEAIQNGDQDAYVEHTLTAHADLWQDKIDQFQLETIEAKADTAKWVSAYNQELVLPQAIRNPSG